MDTYFTSATSLDIPLTALTQNTWQTWLSAQEESTQAWVKAHQFSAKPGQVLVLPHLQGHIQEVIFGLDENADFWQWSGLAQKLPAGSYYLRDIPPQVDLVCLAWGLAFYQFDRYKSLPSKSIPQLVWPETTDQSFVLAMIKAIGLIRDLITTPACDCQPHHLADVARDLATTYQGQCKVIMDEELELLYPSIHTVGRAAAAQPCLIDLSWRHPHAVKKITLVGKGVCFDSGGLDIKPSSNMLLMKKDMGGAAHVLGLSELIMALNLPIELRVLVPAVENAIAGNAMRPLDIIHTKKGTTVEIGNTDAEGRLILADALYEACSTTPDLIIDFATLTGAARIAMGTDIPAFFCNHEPTAQNLLESATQCQDPLWPLPLYPGYKKHLKSATADLSSTGKSSYGGAITAALFLEHFVAPSLPWIHIDLMAWNLASTPGRPEGGEAMGLRAIFDLIKKMLH
jgi:leucyl aminopeptidase